MTFPRLSALVLLLMCGWKLGLELIRIPRVVVDSTGASVGESDPAVFVRVPLELVPLRLFFEDRVYLVAEPLVFSGGGVG